MHRNFVKSNNIPLKGDNTESYNGQYKCTTLLKHGDFTLKDNATTVIRWIFQNFFCQL